MTRACKAPPALIAEGFARRYQPRGWKKYIDEYMGESYEMINHLSVCVDVYGNYVNVEVCRSLIERYDIVCRRLYKLREAWKNYHNG
ncbi:MAG: four helix bundle protein [Candidatus Komeilibacteria bacterium]|nr:four helix bundle protein [Candidatus Komeilibacteria bacterium]